MRKFILTKKIGTAALVLQQLNIMQSGVPEKVVFTNYSLFEYLKAILLFNGSPKTICSCDSCCKYQRNIRVYVHVTSKNEI